MELAETIGIVSSVLTIFLFLTGIPICMRIRKARSTAQVPALPFLAGLLNTGLWLTYGVLINNPIVYVVTTIGVTLHVIYIAVYYTYCQTKKSDVFKYFIYVTTFLLFFSTYTNLLAEPKFGIWLAGIVACVATIGFIAAPLADLGTVMKTKSTASIQLPMAIGNFVLSALNLWYGILIQDPFMQVPNFIGTVLSLLTLSLFVIYPNKPSSKKS